ncbi:MAG: SRPBCC domain-containing protein [Pseudomonadales bacterium]|nr:SRPBCC domain-containing protein [Pseudomonadales bacterium]
MKKIIGIFSVVIFIGIAYLAIEGRNILEVRTEIDISARPSKVWEIITDIDSWQEWSPIINASQGVSSLGSKLSITMMSKEKGKDGPTYTPIITKLDEPNYFHWRAHMLAEFIFTNDKIFKLEKTSTGTKVIHIETFKGLVTPLFRGQMDTGVAPMLNLMNKALKDLAEK